MQSLRDSLIEECRTIRAQTVRLRLSSVRGLHAMMSLRDISFLISYS